MKNTLDAKLIRSASISGLIFLSIGSFSDYFLTNGEVDFTYHIAPSISHFSTGAIAGVTYTTLEHTLSNKKKRI